MAILLIKINDEREMRCMDPKTRHDLKNSIMVVRNLSLLLEQEKLKGAEREQAFKIIAQECEKMLELCK